MTTMIHIVRTPAGEGVSRIREPYVGCTFRLADPAQVEEVAVMHFTGLNIELEPAYSVTFADVIAGLEAARRFDWASHLQMLQRPRLIRFPKDCAELRRA